ncbi:hypothetical protein UlMin_018779 [Ulmus minor]
MIPQDIAKGIAEGDLDPFTKMPFQQQVNASANKTFKLKISDLGNVKKKLDLPVQKNLLTKYFCFASLEAKRKFRAPRLSPNNPSPSSNSSLSPREHASILKDATKDNDTSIMSCSETPSVQHSENEDNAPLPIDMVENGFATEVCESLEPPRHDVEDEPRSPEHALLQQTKRSIHRPCLAQQTDHESKSVRDAVVEGQTRKDNRKVIIRSSYFKHKLIDENNQENEPMISTKDNEDAVPKSALGNGNSNGQFMKRKRPSSDSDQAENVKTKQMCVETDEVKFGSNISHLPHYSDIAEKSLEKFVSIISSFKFSSSGSRASGLRAPLKDVQNTSIHRSTGGVDLSQFAYVPKNRKS